MINTDVSLLRVLIAAVVAYVIGAFWYSPVLFGSKWMKFVGLTKKDMEKAQKEGMAKSYVMGFYWCAHHCTDFFPGA